MADYQQLDTVMIIATNEVYNNEEYELEDAASTYPKITVYDPTPTKKTDDVSMTKIGKGRYLYLQAIATDAVVGTWTGWVTTKIGDYYSTEKFTFTVEAKG